MEGSLHAVYVDGYLVQLELELGKPFSEKQAKYLFGNFPYTIDQLQQLIETTGFTCSELKTRSVQDKIIMFCSYFKQYRGESYTPATLEKANIKNVPVDEFLLTCFFTSKAWWAVNNYTMGNYIMRINHIRDAARNGMEIAFNFPNKYDPKYAAGLDQETLKNYQKHLRAIGYEYKQVGNGWAWIKNDKLATK